MQKISLLQKAAFDSLKFKIFSFTCHSNIDQRLKQVSLFLDILLPKISPQKSKIKSSFSLSSCHDLYPLQFPSSPHISSFDLIVQQDGQPDHERGQHDREGR